MTVDTLARRLHDAYPTPPLLAQAAIAALPEPPRPPATIVDLGAGTGIWGQAAGKRWPLARMVGVELQKLPRPHGYDTWIIEDARTACPPIPDLVIGNPPYTQALAFAERALEMVEHGGMVALLLRLSFLEPTKARGPFLARYPIWRVLVATPRAKFDPDRAGTDSTPSALIIWQRTRAPFGITPCSQPIGALRWKAGEA